MCGILHLCNNFATLAASAEVCAQLSAILVIKNFTITCDTVRVVYRGYHTTADVDLDLNSSANAIAIFV